MAAHTGFLSIRRAASAALLAAILCSACLLVFPAAGSALGGTPTGATHRDAVAFLSRVVRLIAANRYPEAWRSLNPVDQDAAPLERYVACESLTPVPGHLASLQVLAVANRPVRLTSVAAAIPSVEVTFRIVLAGAVVPEGVVVTHAVHAVAWHGRWTWILPRARVETYSNGGC
jgi:hypothetical protein